MMNWLVAVNALFAVITAAFGIFALLAPHKLSGQPENPLYFVKMYAARAVPFGLGLAAVLLWLPEQAQAWLIVAGLIQAGDAWANSRRGILAAVVSPAVLI